MRDVEEWRDISEYEDYYQASNQGRVRSLDRYVKNGVNGVMLCKGRVLKDKKDGGGYCLVIIYKDNRRKTIRVHKLVALAFIRNPENKKCVNHINGVKNDNRVENLEWCTYKENDFHSRFILGNDQRGERSVNAKLVEKQVRGIKLNKCNKSDGKLAQGYGVSRGLIQAIRTGKRWAHVVC